MTIATTPGAAAPVCRRLFGCAILVLPVTGLTGVNALGELRGSASVYVLLALILCFALVDRPGAAAVPRPLLIFAAALVAWFAVDAAVNCQTIATAALGDRTGLAKLVTASMVPVFGLVVAIVAGHLLRRPDELRAIFLRPLRIAVLACMLFAIPELLTWASPAANGVYAWTTGLFHTADNEQGRMPGRLISLAFEAPDLSYFAALSLPWLLLGCRLAWREGTRRDGVVAGLALVSGLALVVLSNSRTGLLMLGGLAVAEAVYWFALRPLRLPAIAVSVTFTAGLVVGVALIEAQLAGVGQTAVMDEDTSTITRSALLSAQLALFSDHPLFGVGFGQYGFHVADVLPSWAWTSYEIQRYFETGSELPPTFNVFGRIGAELGLPGLAIWFGFWIAAVHRIAGAAPRRLPRSLAGDLDAALLASTVCLLVGGTSTDAFRRPETWVLVAIAALYAGAKPRRTGSLA